MIVTKIVVRYLPGDCRICNFCDDEEGIKYCRVIFGKKLPEEYGRPDWCILELEDDPQS